MRLIGCSSMQISRLNKHNSYKFRASHFQKLGLCSNLRILEFKLYSSKQIKDILQYEISNGLAHTKVQGDRRVFAKFLEKKLSKLANTLRRNSNESKELLKICEGLKLYNEEPLDKRRSTLRAIYQYLNENPFAFTKNLDNANCEGLGLFFDNGSDEVDRVNLSITKIESDNSNTYFFSQVESILKGYLKAAEDYSKATQLKVVENILINNGKQRSRDWHNIRQNKLTASSFCNALGFFPESREHLWEEKLRIRPKFRGNEASNWGVQKEEEAIRAYIDYTGNTVSYQSFQTYGNLTAESWLGASPDGLFLNKDGTQGLVEVKCPYKINANLNVPYNVPPMYYMPQVQGQMEIFNCDWCHLWSYTQKNGSTLFAIKRDRNYWALCFEVLADFWWSNVIPAKQCLEMGDTANAMKFRPQSKHPLTTELMSWSKSISGSVIAH